MYQKLKSFILDDTVFGVLVITLVGIGSFGLGRLSVQESSTPVNVTQSAAVLQPLKPLPPVIPPPVTQKVEVTPTAAAVEQGAVIASKSGTKYHLPSCPGAKQIKPENKITFASITEARAAGYTPAANCPGL